MATHDPSHRPTAPPGNEATDETADLLHELQRREQELQQTRDELRRRQEELGRLNTELDETNRGVLALYAELDERAERLRQSDGMKSRFLSNMSHEFRTPLNSILALSRLLLSGTDGPLTGEQELQLQYVRTAAQHLSDMVNDLLDLAKVEAGKVDVQPVAFEVSELFGTLRGMMRPLLSDSAVDLVFETPVSVPTLHTDEGKVSQILRNFLSNALKFTEQGEIRVSATVVAEGYVRLSVTDTGIGIAPEDQERIFHEFGQLDNPVQRRVRGTGLGLPLSRKLADLLGGQLTVESQPGVGSTFSIAIPIRYSARDTSSSRIAPAATSEVISPGDREHVLIIDDDPGLRYALRKHLAASGWVVREAVDGESGLRAAAESVPAVIFLDLIMPGLGGIEVLGQLRRSETTRHVPVVVVTSKALDDTERSWLSARGVAILPKQVMGNGGAAEEIRRVLAEAGLVHMA